MSQHLTVAPDPGRQARDNSLNQGASCGSGLGGGAATAARPKHKTAAQPIQLYSASRPWTDRRCVWRGLIVLMAPYRAALFYRIPRWPRALCAGFRQIATAARCDDLADEAAAAPDATELRARASVQRAAAQRSGIWRLADSIDNFLRSRIARTVHLSELAHAHLRR